jgi:GTP pyrophosphokinase
MGPKGRWVGWCSERDGWDCRERIYAHYKYKNGIHTRRIGCLNLLKKHLKIHKRVLDFVEDFKWIFTQRKFMFFTPIKSPYQRTTSLDFAFSIHSEIGIKTHWNACKQEISSSKLWTKKWWPSRNHHFSKSKIPLTGDYVTIQSKKNKIRNVLNENTKKLLKTERDTNS